MYQGTFWKAGSKYSTDMPTISLDLPDETLPDNAIRIETSKPEEVATPDDPRGDERVHGVLQKTGRLDDTRSIEPPADPAVEKATLPTLKVRVLDKQGAPIANAAVLVYDRNHYMAGMPVDFKQISKPTDKDGWADLGVLPQDYICVQVNGREKGVQHGLRRYLRGWRRLRTNQPQQAAGGNGAGRRGEDPEARLHRCGGWGE
jgi:hypothetical protein